LAGVVLLCSEGAIAGAFVGLDFAVAPDHQGFGLGAELVAERVLRDHELPAWHQDKPAHSFTGWCAAMAAHRLLLKPAFLAQKSVLRSG